MTNISIYLLSRLNLLGPAALCPLLVDFGLLPGSPYILLACTEKPSQTISPTDSKMYIQPQRMTRAQSANNSNKGCNFVFNFMNIVRSQLFFNQHSPVRHFDDIVCELHAFKGHGLPLNTGARPINKSLQEENNSRWNSTVNTAPVNASFYRTYTRFWSMTSTMATSLPAWGPKET